MPRFAEWIERLILARTRRRGVQRIPSCAFPFTSTRSRFGPYRSHRQAVILACAMSSSVSECELKRATGGAAAMARPVIAQHAMLEKIGEILKVFIGIRIQPKI